MTDRIKQKALALVNEAAKGVIYYELDDLDDLERVYFTEALCRAIEQHEALEAENERLREACHAIWQRGIERDPKWFGMSAADIARAALGEKQ